MKFRFAMIFSVLNIVPFSCFGAWVKMPEARVLEERLSGLAMDDFAQKTGLAEKLGGREVMALAVTNEVEAAYDDYRQKQPDPIFAITVNELKPFVIKALLQDFPAAIAELKGHGILR